VANELKEQDEATKRRLSGHRRMSGCAPPQQAAEIAAELQEDGLEDSEDAKEKRRLSSHRRMSGAAMPAQANRISQDLLQDIQVDDRRKSNMSGAASKRGSMLNTPAGSSRPNTGAKGAFRRVSAKVAMIQAPAKPQVRPVPMLCPRCLKGDIPSFPYVSVGELSRTHHIDVSAGVDDSSSPSAASNGSESEGELAVDDPEAAQELGEDIVLSWATGVLTDGIVLCKDERGDYFRWLARIVLYDMLDEDVLQERAKSRGSSRADKDGGPSRATTAQSGSKRMSFLQVLSAASQSMESSTEQTDGLNEESTQTNSSSQKSKPSGLASTSLSLASLIHDIKEGNVKANAMQKRKADEAQQIREAERDWSIPIPDLHLGRMRVDLGVRLTSEDEDLRNGNGPRRGSLSNNLLSKYHSRVERQAEMRQEREAELMQSLHFLSVPEFELQALRKELTAAAQLPPNSTGLLLVGGTPQICQRILVPKATRRPVPRDEQDEQAALKKALEALRKEGRSAADMAAHTEVKRIAKEIVHLSAENSSSCYHMAGYEEQEQKDKVAAALRLLEHELFHSVELPGQGGEAAGEAPSAAIGGGPKDKTIHATAPLLLSKQAARRLVNQAKREEAEAAAAAAPPTVEAVRLEPRRKARVKEALKQSMSDLSDKDSDDSARSDLADNGEKSRARRRWSDQRLNSMLQRDYSPISNTPRVSASRTPQHSDRGLSSRGGAFGAVFEVDDLPEEEFCPDVIDWHPSVKSLLESVSKRGARVRNTARPLRQEALRRSASDPVVSHLPALSLQAGAAQMTLMASASPQRGAKGHQRKAFHKARADQFQLEGWRAKVVPSDVGSLCGAGLFPKVEREGLLQ